MLGGAASSYKFVKEFPQAANGIIDCNHWFNPKDKRSAELKKRAEEVAKMIQGLMRRIQDDLNGERDEPNA